MTAAELSAMIQQAKDLMVKGDCYDTESYRDRRHQWFTEAFELLSNAQYLLNQAVSRVDSWDRPVSA